MMKVYVRLFFLLIFLHSVIVFAPSLGLSQEPDCDCYDFQGNIVERAPTQPGVESGLKSEIAASNLHQFRGNI